jgi:hypothetical protein
MISVSIDKISRYIPENLSRGIIKIFKKNKNLTKTNHIEVEKII